MTGMQFEFSRKTVHLVSLLVPVSILHFPLTTKIVIACFIVFYAFSEWRKVRGLPFFAHRFISKMQRNGEKDAPAPAPLYLAAGVLVATAFFSWEASLIGIYQAGFCDTVAAWCGKKWGKTRIPFYSRKTFVGSFAFFASALPVALVFLPPAPAIVLSLLGAYLESLPFRDLDNLTVPIIIAFLADQFLLR